MLDRAENRILILVRYVDLDGIAEFQKWSSALTVLQLLDGTHLQYGGRSRIVERIGYGAAAEDGPRSELP